MHQSKLLYLGTDPTHYKTSKQIVHYPVIEMVPRDFNQFNIKTKFSDLQEYTHLIFTSKTAVHVFMDAIKFYHLEDSMKDKEWICIGSSTERALASYNVSEIQVAHEETQEGVIRLLDLLDLEKSYLFYPRSSRARPTLSSYLQNRRLRHQICDLYDTKALAPIREFDLNQFDEIVFTSPSTVEAFFEVVPQVPCSISLTPLGPVTAMALKRFLRNT